MILAAVVNGIVEMLSRGNIWNGVVHLCTAPHIFIYNTCIIFFTLSFALLLRKRKFASGFICMAWLLAGVVNFILKLFRKTPFMANDFLLIGDAFKIGPVYLGKAGFAALVIAAVLVIAVVPVLWYRASVIVMEKSDYLKAVGVIAVSYAVMNFMTFIGLHYGVLSLHYSNIGLACEQYGYAYCFGSSFFQKGIEKPDNYSQEEIHSIIDSRGDAEKTYTKEPEQDYPNIIFLQLESFMNPNLIRGVEYSQNPVEYFQKLLVNYPSGYLNVPAFGAGTANTEFEIMTGMNLDDFGPGEYPYKSVLKNQTCESMAYILKKLGYTAHAIHNNDGTFYGRNTVLKNLGYDTFTSLEYMGEYETTPTGWAKDGILVQEINKALDATEGKDYIYAISVQGHGDYPEELEGMNLPIEETGFFEPEEENGFRYYINQLDEMDEFIRELTDSLSARDEKTVLVLYGDHLPGFSFTDDVLYNEDIYQTQYVIWNNFDLWLPKKTLEAYQLSSWVLDALDIEEGTLNAFHQNSRDSQNYLEELTMLEYDMLYGDGEVYGEDGGYFPSDMVMGVEPITITAAYNYDGHICVEGTNFTTFSAVSVNGRIANTVCVNEHTLVVEGMELAYGDAVTVVQRGTDKIVLSTTEAYFYAEGGNSDEGENLFDSGK